MLLVCVTEALKEIVVRESGIPLEKVVVIPNGVDIESFDQNGMNPCLRALQWGFVGRLYAWQVGSVIRSHTRPAEGLIYHWS